MEDTSRIKIESLLQNHRAFFATNQTKPVAFRLHMLKKFKSAIREYEKRITDALWTDLHKSPEEAYLSEILIVLHEIDLHIRKLNKWAKPQKAKTPFYLFPSSSMVLNEPLGVALIIAPWNYPFQLLMNSVVGAISSGCCAMLKPSPYTPAVAKVMEDMVSETFPSEYLSIVQGSRKVNAMLLEQRFDFIFFTGSPNVGKVVMQAASQHLTPLVLELGGKSPCIVDKDADLDASAGRIALGKTLNAGQTCIAPDYLFAHRSIKNKLIEKIGKNIVKMYGEDIQQSPFLTRIVNEQAFDRLENLMHHGTLKFGGKIDRNDKFISPTIIDDVKPDFPIMQEEIFGPLLPVLVFDDVEEVISYINANEKPLAFYYFGKSKTAMEVISKTTSGGGCINDTLMHLTNPYLPFGGVGNSGLGKYHGKNSFLAFSNQRAFMKTTTKINLPFKFSPYPLYRWIKKII